MRYRKLRSHKRSDELLESILNGSTEYAIIVTDLNEIVMLWNKGAEMIYGYTSEEMIGNKAPISIQSKIISDNGILLSESLLKTSIFDQEVNVARKDGTVIPVSVTVTPRLNKNKEIIGFLIISRDISGVKMQETFKDVLLDISYAVNTSPGIKELCQSVINTISTILDIKVVFVCLFDYLNNQFYVNSHTGLCSDECHHKCSYLNEGSDVSENMKDCYLTYTERSINTGNLSEHVISEYLDKSIDTDENTSIIHIPLIYNIAMQGILHIVLPDAKKDFLLVETQVLSLIANETSAGIQRIRLIEEIKQDADTLEGLVKIRAEQLREKDAQLVQSGKLATLGEMAAGIAHEMNQPLGSISLMAQGLMKAKSLNRLTDNLLNDKLTSIIEQVDRISKLITHLRTFARQSENTREAVSVNDPLTDTFKLIGQQLKNRNIKINASLDKNLEPIFADHNKLEQIFINIIGNARDALDDFENKVFEQNKKNDIPDWAQNWKKEINLKTYMEYDFVVIEISDTAGGIPKSILSRIFEPFFTTKEVGKGTGLGLSITYGIVREFEGTIDVESEEFKGTMFKIKFPAYKK